MIYLLVGLCFFIYNLCIEIEFTYQIHPFKVYNSMVLSILQNCEIFTTIYYNFRIFGSFKKNPIPISNHLLPAPPTNQVLTTPALVSVSMDLPI